MLDTLIQSKTRLKLLLRFFLNPESSAYLRGLEKEFGESTNAIRVELNRFLSSGLIHAVRKGNKRYYKANTSYPIFEELQMLAFKHLGIDKLIDHVISKLGKIDAVYITGDLARGIDAQIVDIAIIGNSIDVRFLAKLVQKAEQRIGRRIRYLVFKEKSEFVSEEPYLLIYGNDESGDK